MQLVLRISYAADSSTGTVRNENQDSYGKFPADSDDLADDQLFVIADGMGGHRGGETASHMAVEIIGHAFFNSPSGDPVGNIQKAFEMANSRIFARARQEDNLNGMGTTCSTLLVEQTSATVAHVGDSRVYRIHNDKITQVTNDHSQVAEMQRYGIITEEEARDHPYRSVITRALGAGEDIEVDIIENLMVLPGDAFVLCTDGLAMVDEEEIRTIVTKSSSSKACKELIAKANARSGVDNVTVIVIKFHHASNLNLIQRFSEWVKKALPKFQPEILPEPT